LFDVFCVVVMLVLFSVVVVFGVLFGLCVFVFCFLLWWFCCDWVLLLGLMVGVDVVLLFLLWLWCIGYVMCLFVVVLLFVCGVVLL
jgi:hypothetical protein